MHTMDIWPLEDPVIPDEPTISLNVTPFSMITEFGGDKSNYNDTNLIIL